MAEDMPEDCPEPTQNPKLNDENKLKAAMDKEIQYGYPEEMLSQDKKCGNCAAFNVCLLYTSPSPRDRTRSRMPSSA